MFHLRWNLLVASGLVGILFLNRVCCRHPTFLLNYDDRVNTGDEPDDDDPAGHPSTPEDPVRPPSSEIPQGIPTPPADPRQAEATDSSAPGSTYAAGVSSGAYQRETTFNDEEVKNGAPTQRDSFLEYELVDPKRQNAVKSSFHRRRNALQLLLSQRRSASRKPPHFQRRDDGGDGDPPKHTEPLKFRFLRISECDSAGAREKLATKLTQAEDRKDSTGARIKKLMEEIKALENDFEKFNRFMEAKNRMIRKSPLSASVAATTEDPSTADNRNQKGPDKIDDEIAAAEKRLKNLELIANAHLPRTCEQLRSLGHGTSGYYKIDPDGPHGKGTPIEVYCDMENGETVVERHVPHITDDDRPEQVTTTTTRRPPPQRSLKVILVCRRGLCKSPPLTYKVPNNQIRALARQSSGCSQDVEVEDPAEEMIPKKLRGWWVDSSGHVKPLPLRNVTRISGSDQLLDVELPHAPLVQAAQAAPRIVAKKVLHKDITAGDDQVKLGIDVYSDLDVDIVDVNGGRVNVGAGYAQDSAGVRDPPAEHKYVRVRRSPKPMVTIDGGGIEDAKRSPSVHYWKNNKFELPIRKILHHDSDAYDAAETPAMGGRSPGGDSEDSSTTAGRQSAAEGRSATATPYRRRILAREVGHLRCRGKREALPSTPVRADTMQVKGVVSVPVYDGCHTLHDAGITESGYYWIKTGDVYRLVFCDMHFLFEDESRGIAQIPIGPRQAASPVHFHAYRKTPWNFRQQIITYEHFHAKHKAFNTSVGWFEAPVAGFYRFNFQTLNAGHRRHHTGTEVFLVRQEVAVNGAITCMIPWAVGITQAVMKLNQGDIIYMRIFFGGAFSNERGLTFFSGSLLDPS